MEIGQFCKLKKDLFVDVKKHNPNCVHLDNYATRNAGTRVVICDTTELLSHVVVIDKSFRYEVAILDLESDPWVGLKKVKEPKKDYESIW